MNLTTSIITHKAKIILDLIALLFIAFLPAISHILPIPFYLMEPMRLFVLVALLLTNSTNAYFLALTLPILAFISTSHPVFAKSLLISMELCLNVTLFYLLTSKINNIGFVILVHQGF
jgi:hypothetical protein